MQHNHPRRLFCFVFATGLVCYQPHIEFTFSVYSLSAIVKHQGPLHLWPLHALLVSVSSPEVFLLCSSSAVCPPLLLQPQGNLANFFLRTTVYVERLTTFAIFFLCDVLLSFATSVMIMLCAPLVTHLLNHYSRGLAILQY